MGFTIKVKNGLFEWQGNGLICNDRDLMAKLKEELQFHRPEIVAYPDLVDYTDDLSDGRNAYYAITGTFNDCEVIEKPTEEFLDYGFNKDVIY